MARQWAEMSPGERREERFGRWLSPAGVTFSGPRAEKAYRERVTRFARAFQLQEPDRVPCILPASFFAAFYAGTNLGKVMYDYDEMRRVWLKFLDEFEADTYFGPIFVPPGRALEALDYKLYKWPGHGVAPEHCYQCVEQEYMKAGEYDLLISDPSFYFRNFYLPRVFGALQGFTMLPPLTGILEIYGVAFNFIPYALPPVQGTFKALFEAGAEALKWAMVIGGLNAELATLGYPNILGGFTKAPFDTIGDTLRGTRGIIMDMYRQPDKLLKAMEALVPIMIGMGIGSAQQTGNPQIFMPLHKGADGFLSDEQFKKFYWPTFRAVMLGLIEGGCIPFPALEGHWSSRLEIIQDIPRG
jgi:hypothetical protein